MDEKIAVVTGATSGIGRATALELARRGYRIAIVCRNEAKGKATVAEIERSTPGAGAEIFLADLSVLADVRAVAARLGERLDRLDVLVNNAGVHDGRSGVSADGFDRMIATNHLGPFLLTNLLTGLLTASAPARVVVVSSEAHRWAGRFDPETLAEPGSYGKPGSFRVYGRSKLLNILFAQELAARLAGTGVTANALCPGAVVTGLSTGIAHGLPARERLGALLQRTPLLRTPAQGARMVVRLATEPGFEGRTGGFVASTRAGARLPVVAARRDTTFQRAVWDRSADLVSLPAR
ncbi:SDR family NAD(P)-dependent oxidoreductase [Spirillospora sp. NPDC047279]|uniref:SDR family NAD(P)-dependent oxidoreductase n=1 Tax=Spirillospora sp. NPDC047279 TaxID=3155478 RepID=UPI00340A53BA